MLCFVINVYNLNYEMNKKGYRLCMIISRNLVIYYYKIKFFVQVDVLYFLLLYECFVEIYWVVFFDVLNMGEERVINIYFIFLYLKV